MADVTMPQLGETVTEGTITQWFKNVGDAVAMDEILFEVSTDKVDSEVPSPVAGVVTEILAAEVVTTEDVDRTGVTEDVVIQPGADGGQSTAGGHILTEAVPILRITGQPFGHALKRGRIAVEDEVTDTGIGAVLIVARSADDEHVAVQVKGTTEAVPAAHCRRGEVVRFRPWHVSRTGVEELIQRDGAALCVAIEVGLRRTRRSAVAADAHIRTEAVAGLMTEEGHFEVPALVVEPVQVRRSSQGAIVRIAVFTGDEVIP